MCPLLSSGGLEKISYRKPVYVRTNEAALGLNSFCANWSAKTWGWGVGNESPLNFRRLISNRLSSETILFLPENFSNLNYRMLKQFLLNYLQHLEKWKINVLVLFSLLVSTYAIIQAPIQLWSGSGNTGHIKEKQLWIFKMQTLAFLTLVSSVGDTICLTPKYWNLLPNGLTQNKDDRGVICFGFLLQLLWVFCLFSWKHQGSLWQLVRAYFL